MDRIERRAVQAVLDALAQHGRDAETLKAAGQLIDMLKPARFTREDVEKAARAVYETRAKQVLPNGDFIPWESSSQRQIWFDLAHAALSVIGDVEHG